MFAPYQHILTRLKEFEQQIDRIVLDAVKEYEPEILDMNLAQLDAGIDGEGNRIEPGYRPMTVAIKRMKGQPTGRVTLKDEGDFHDGFKLRYGKDYFAFYSTDGKAEKLERKYGKDIFGLTQENIQEVKELIRDNITVALRQIVNG